MRLLTVILILLSFLLILPADLEASTGFMLSASSAEGKPGDQVVISINAENAAGSEGGQFLLLFDSDIIQPIDLQAGEMIENANNNLHMTNLDYLPGELLFMWIVPEADTEDSGVICEITFKLVSEGSSNLQFDEVVLVPDHLELTMVEAGQVVVGGTIPVQKGENGNGIDEALEDDGKSIEEEDNEEQEIAAEDITQDESLLSTGAARTNLLLYISVVIVIVLAIGLSVLSILIKKKRNKTKAGR